MLTGPIRNPESCDVPICNLKSLFAIQLEMSGQWQDICAARKKKQHDSIPPDWLIQLPPDDQLNVLDVPYKCGLLSPRELEITETIDVDIILRKLSTAEWSSVEVTTAFLKRAVVAQQLVHLTHFKISFSSELGDGRQTA